MNNINSAKNMPTTWQADNANASNAKKASSTVSTDNYTNTFKQNKETNRLIQAFDALNNYSVSGIMNHWTKLETSVYDNSMVGPPATGQADIEKCMVSLVNLLKESSSQLKINRVIEGNDDNGKSHCIVEWTPIPDDGREGLHLCHFDKDGFIQNVVVYVRNRYE